MSAADVLGAMAVPVGVADVRAGDLQVGMTVALPCRDRWFGWRVLAPVEPASTDGLVQVLMVRPHGVGVVTRAFDVGQLLRVLPRHHGACSRCGGVAPCVDEVVEHLLASLGDELRAAEAGGPVSEPGGPGRVAAKSAGGLRAGSVLEAEERDVERLQRDVARWKADAARWRQVARRRARQVSELRRRGRGRS